jgi:hypothetical protein
VPTAYGIIMYFANVGYEVPTELGLLQLNFKNCKSFSTKSKVIPVLNYVYIFKNYNMKA